MLVLYYIVDFVDFMPLHTANRITFNEYHSLHSSCRLMRLRHLITNRLYTHWSPLRRLGNWCHSYNVISIMTHLAFARYSVKEDYDDGAGISLSFSCSTTGSAGVCSVVAAAGLSVSPFDSCSADEVLRCECGARGLSRIGEVLLAMIPLVEVERVGWPA